VRRLSGRNPALIIRRPDNDRHAIVKRFYVELKVAVKRFDYSSVQLP
jgi:hypothetical protein